ncbi:glycosyltransferase family 2 protein [Marinivivus vitaminiproducens]|uniref:glycosyltransferase family 2 protein n=1 Tax=Marinivivus vitaminiproducens TaxID=3035935 RepID=UPI00279F7CF1|nr:glycosyltransferase family 2 protein [Geminicoccaceae bacterium SCSIO 64248]
MPTEKNARAGKVSVVIPCFNRSDLLCRAIGSVLGQTRPDVEILVVDDCSTEDLRAGLAPVWDERVRILRNDTNRGGGYSRRRGALEATGDYVAFLDSDDWWVPEKLERQLAVAATQPDDRFVLTAKHNLVVAERFRVLPRHVIAPDTKVSDFVYTQHGTLPTSSILLPAGLAKEITFDPDLRVSQETDFLIRLQKAGARVIQLDEPLSFFDANPRPDRVSYNPQNIERSKAWFDRVSGDWSVEARKAYYFADLAIRCANNGRRGEALRYFFKGVRPSYGVERIARVLARVLLAGPPPAPVLRLLFMLRAKSEAR